MRTIPDAVKTLFANKVMVGANGPKAKVYIGGVDVDSATGYKLTNWTAQTTIRDSAGSGNWVHTNDGRIITTYTKNGKVYLSYVEDEATILSQYDSAVANEWAFAGDDSTVTSGYYNKSRLHKRQDGGLILVIALVYDYEGSGRHRKLVNYYDPTGNGAPEDWQYVGVIFDTGAYNVNGSFNLDVFDIKRLQSGRIAFTGNISVFDSGWQAYVSHVYFVRSDDDGMTWNTWRQLFSGMPTNIGIGGGLAQDYQTGTLFTVNAYDYSSYELLLDYSTDDGETWTLSGWDMGLSEPYGYPNRQVTFAADGYCYLSIDVSGRGTGLYRWDMTKYPLPTNAQTFFTVTSGHWELVLNNCWAHAWVSEDGNLIVSNRDQGYWNMGNPLVASDYATPIESITIDRSKQTLAASATVSLDNKWGLMSPDNPSSKLYKKSGPGNGIEIKLGYGSNLVQSFYGYLDKASETSFPQKIQLQCRDNMRTAVDQMIYYNNQYNRTFTNVSPEYVFQVLAEQHCGLTGGMVGFDTTGIVINKKDFQWQTVGDAFSWLQDFVGFEVWSDEYGNYWYKNPSKGLPVATPAWRYKEGQDIVQIGLDIDDSQQYRYIVGIASTGSGKTQKSLVYTWTNPLADDLHLPAHKTKKVDLQEAVSYDNLKMAVDNIGIQMVAQARKVQWVVPGNPWLQLGDSCQINEISTQLSAIYRVLEIRHEFSSQGFLTTFTAYKYQ